MPPSLPGGDYSEPIRLLHAGTAFGTWAGELFPPQRAAPCALQALPQDRAQVCPLAPWAHETCKSMACIRLRIPGTAGLVAAPLHHCQTNTSMLGRRSARLAGLARAPFWEDVLVTVDPCLLKSWGPPLPSCFLVPGWEHPAALASEGSAGRERGESSCAPD